MTEVGIITQVGEKHISRVNHRCIPRGWAPSISQIFFWDPYLCLNGLAYSDQIWCDSTRVTGACFWGSAMPHIPKGWVPASPKSLGLHTCMHTVWQTTTKICVLFKIPRKFLYGQPQKLMHDLFAVANLFATG